MDEADREREMVTFNDEMYVRQDAFGETHLEYL